MLYNLRSDIIYYKSSSDFELEFNLCGCCRMRLLTDKPSNKKAFVHLRLPPGFSFAHKTNAPSVLIDD